MATPNLINVDTITPKVAVGAVTTSRADIVDVTAEYCAKINSLIIANIDAIIPININRYDLKSSNINELFKKLSRAWLPIWLKRTFISSILKFDFLKLSNLSL